MKPSHICILPLAAAILALSALSAVAEPSITPGDPRIIRLTGQVVSPTGTMAGEVLVEGNQIKCVAASCPSPGATVIATDGIIYPGLIDAHNHGAFNLFDEGDWNPGSIFKNHNQWPRNDARYKEVMAAKKDLEATAGGNASCEMVKYGELKALVAGTTSMLLAPKATVRTCFGSLVRTIDTRYNDLDGKDTIQTSISVPTNDGAASVCQSIDDGKTKAYMVHVGEGIDGTSRKEFDTLIARSDGCLRRKETTIVHGTAFGLPEFQKMAATGKDMALVWSPASNMFLYKKVDGSLAVPRIDLAIQAGVKTIALGCDWALGGSQNLLDELRVARKVATDSAWSAVTDERLFRMVTIDAAKALGVADRLGEIAVGKRADLMVVTATGDPHQALISATPKNVRLVMIDGKILYGDQSLSAVAAFPNADSFDACGTPKFLCVAEPDGTTTDKRKQRLGDIVEKLTSALQTYEQGLPQTVTRFLPLSKLVRCP